MKKLIITIFLFLTLIFSSLAQEGLWLLNQIDKLDLNKKGLKIGVKELFNPEKPALHRAIVQLGGGTASFVSPEGLLVTNHHVAYTALQRTSSEKSDYLLKGFLAADKTKEIPAPGYQAKMVIKMKDVTAEILKDIEKITDPAEKAKKVNEKISTMTKEIEKESSDLDATVSENYNGKQYILYVYKVFKDIRIVYAPPLSIGNYGGEIDNWMWPRHTGDFSFMRVYASPDGKGKEYNKDNVPYKPEVWLKTATSNLKDGDFTFVIGFPGQTTRYRSSNSADWNYRINYPFNVKNFKEIIEILDNTTKGNREGELKVANLKKGLANTMKNFQGKIDGMRKINFVQKKLDFEKELLKWANANPERKQKYGSVISDEAEEYKILAKTKDRDNIVGLFQGLAGAPLNVASTVYFIVGEMDKPATERQPGITEEAVQQTIDGLKYTYADYYEPAEKALMVRALKMVADLKGDQRVPALDYIFNDNSKSIEQFVDECFKNSKLTDLESAKELFKKPKKELFELNDPFIKIMAALDPVFTEIQKVGQNFNVKVTALRKKYIDALYEWKGSNIYPDANGTIRFTSGKVMGYRPADAVWYYPFTTLKGVIEKNTGEEPFDAPKDLIDIYNRKDYGRWSDPNLKDVPIAFTHQIDITGGNSGSPVMNAKGEIIGIVFDGNYEAMIGDWQYDYDLQRAISVDMRYVLFVTEKIGKAGFLLDEMRVKK